MTTPKLYYESPDGQAKLYHGDARYAVELGLAGQVDALFCDPPYQEVSHGWDRWPDGWPAALRPLLKRQGSMWCCGSFKMFMLRRDEFQLYKIAQDCIWEKHNGSNMMNDRFRRIHEMVVQFWPREIEWGEVYKLPQYTPTAERVRVKRQGKPAHWHGIGDSEYATDVGGPVLVKSVLRVPSMAGRTFKSRETDAKNDTQKPFDLLAPLLKYSAPPGGLILDPFSGSGSVSALALCLGYRVIAFDVREEQCQLTKERIVGGSLFEGDEASWSASRQELEQPKEKPPLFEEEGERERIEISGNEELLESHVFEVDDDAVAPEPVETVPPPVVEEEKIETKEAKQQPNSIKDQFSLFG